jgi:hypothetical protein
MRDRLMGSLAVLATAFALAPAMLAQTGRPAAAKPEAKGQSYDPRDFSGVWDPALYMQPKNQVFVDGVGKPKDDSQLPPFTPVGRAQYDANVKFIAAGDVNSCDPYGTARNYFTPRPFEVIVAKDRVIQHFEYYDNWREIWTDGRAVPDDIDPDFMGYSTGKWDGDAFVVDSLDYNGKQFLTWQGLPLSTQMHQTERWQRIDHDTLKIYFTFDDPKYYARPWHITYFYKLKDWTLDAHPCTIEELKAWDKVGHRDRLPGLDYTPQK